MTGGLPEAHGILQWKKKALNEPNSIVSKGSFCSGEHRCTVNDAVRRRVPKHEVDSGETTAP
jgi:hypothetical protein